MDANISAEVGVEGAIAGAHLLSRPAEEFGNDPNLETAWAMKAVEHMEVYFNLLCSVDPRLLKLTPHDDEIFKEFKETFPDFSVSVLCEDKIKSEESKMKWRPFCNKFANIVEDYNFGTLVRIDSSDEYSEKNSILVPRIQFYAIEIARNREGLNDGIRSKFKPTPRTKEPILSVSCCWITKIVSHIEEVFNSICCQHNLSPVAIKQLIRKESGSENKGDFSVFLGSPQMKQFIPYLDLIVQQITCNKSNRAHILDNCIILSNHLIKVKMDRPSILCEVLDEVAKLKELYGRNNSGQKSSVLIAVCSSNEFSEKSFACIRTKAVAEHLASVLRYNGFRVFLAADSVSRSSEVKSFPVNENYINCSEMCNTDTLAQSLLRQAKVSKWRKDPSEIKYTRKTVLDTDTLNLCEEVILDSREYINEKSKVFKYKTYFKKLDSICVQANGLTQSFKRAVHLEHIVSDHLTVIPEWIIHIGPECKAHVMKSSGLLFEMLTVKKPAIQQIYMTFVSGNIKTQLENDADHLLRKVKQEMEDALVHKYGTKVLNEQTWMPCINILTDTVIKFNLLSTPCSRVINAEELEIKSKTQSKKRTGTFVQYNCARLFRLFKRHEELINAGRYCRLPSVGEVDFTLLKLEEEWSLFFNYVLPFPKLISGISECLQQNHTARVHCPSHEVCRMLMDLSHELSLYYSRTRILVEPVPHLEKTMAARIWLLRAIHQVMKNALSLLGIEALEEM